jgi:hypothetical protein
MKFKPRAFSTLLTVIGGAFGILRTRHSIKVFLTGGDRRADPSDNRERDDGCGKFLIPAAVEPWTGTAVETNLVLAGGERAACDVVGSGIIQSFGKWHFLERISPRQMRQVKRAVEMGLGAASREEMDVLTESFDSSPLVTSLMSRAGSLVGPPRL